MVDLKAKPFHLTDAQCAWVQQTYGVMSLEEKIGQLFITLNLRRDPAYIREMCEKYHVGGVRWQGGTLEEVHEQNRLFNEYSKVPPLIAANCEAGGNGAVPEGTLVAPHAACGAAPGVQAARDLGYVSGQEATAVGCNVTFAPISDVYLNWRNTIVNTRSFGSDPDRVIELSRAYMEGVAQSGMACCTKHFPGDGSEERDQHLLMGCNDLSCEEWDASYGRVYSALIDAGVECVMAGHICLPAYSKRLRPGLADGDILPATLAPELITGLLRGQLGFNGVVITDASHMAGMTCAMPRREQVPGAIAAGCDMFLFFSNHAEDFGYMLEGYKNGVITEERLSDAVHRILGLKAKLGLDRPAFPPKQALARVGCGEHHAIAQKAADASITLVKDTQGLLPVRPGTHPRAKLFFIESAPMRLADGTDPVKRVVVEELERAGFSVSLHQNYYDLEQAHSAPENKHLVSDTGLMEDFRKNYDVVFVFVHMKGYAQENNVRLRWSASHSAEVPWYCQEVPTVGVSLNYTNHLIDLPMLKTFINAYAPTREYIRAAIGKMTGESEFSGRFDDTVWCGRWDTRL